MINLSKLLTGQVDKTLTGITNYVNQKAENLTNGFVRNFILSNEEKMTFLNDVYIDLCFGISDANNAVTPTHNLDNNSIIAETIRKEPTVWQLECKLTSIDHREKYDKLISFMENAELVTLMFRGEVKENLVVMSINRKISNVHYTDFTITLAKLNFVKIATIPAPTFKKITSKPKTSVASKFITEKARPFPKPLNVPDLDGTVGPSSNIELDGIAGAEPVNVINPFTDLGRSGGGAF